MEKKYKFISNNSQETQDYAKQFSKSISPPLVINLVGDLGAGKTTFSQGLLKGLGITEPVTSPTFTLLNEYQAEFPVYHFDMYRIDDPNETEQLGFEEYFDLNTLKGITLVEWACKTPHLLPKKYLQIDIKHLDDSCREIIITEVGE